MCAIVTGSNSGLGYETSRQLLDLGLSKLILAVRNTQKGNEAASKLRLGRELLQDTIEVWSLDLSDYDSIRTGHDEIVQVNYLSNALLAILLLQVVKDKNSKAPTKITFTSSELPAFSKFQERAGSPLLLELDKPGRVDLQDRMTVSKLLCQFFVARLAQHVPCSVAVINLASPSGLSDSTMLQGHNNIDGAITRFMMRRIGRTCAEGAKMMVDAIVQRGEETHGKYFMAPVIYTEEGKVISDRLWDETMAELAFAKVEEILRTVSI
ncbi:hypothetical protein KVR01_013022 [Diaporthe batatas]|uniref:uncharacterized protein n=1 Tax=Diaporthe batatas TaxID=748121 RepID=UPI001D04F7D1|nr:uncharacterized protein KVR01_013022 [Diaporthe batatas]KAG8157032.1 hypothetical protein KVR01_013022 [Diaporthe batatas]